MPSIDIHFSSQTCVWSTPDWLFQELHKEFSFTLDVCALPENTKCRKYYTPEDDGLLMPWGGAVVWCNPPYGNRIGDWLQKGYRESFNGATCIFLLPARTDVRWFHDWILGKADEIRFVKGRLKFGGSEHNAPFPSMIVIYKAKNNA